MKKIVLADWLTKVTEHWRPLVVASLNGQEVKLVKLRGEFVWHHHKDEDELFLPLDGRMRVEFQDHVVDLHPGELLVVPKGVAHRTTADDEVACLVFEPAGTINTGNVRDPRFTAPETGPVE